MTAVSAEPTISDQIVEALVHIGERLGVRYRLQTPVSSVTVSADGRRATGVQLESGERLQADVVIVNADLVYAYNHLLPPSPRAAKLSARSASCSSISFYWSMDRIVPELKAHNIFLADAYRESFDDIFKRQQMPDQPSFYVNVPSRVDPTAAPPGRDSIVVLVPVGHLLEGGAGRGLEAHRQQDWDAMVERARQTVFTTIEARTGATGLRASVTAELVNTPLSWKERFNLDKGAILGLSHSFFNVLSFRPSTKHPDLVGCYFVGASTHPGTGVPICLAGSRITSEQVLTAYGIAPPWPAADRDDGPGANAYLSPGKARRDIDREQRLEKGPFQRVVFPFLISVLVVYLSTVVFPFFQSEQDPSSLTERIRAGLFGSTR